MHTSGRCRKRGGVVGPAIDPHQQVFIYASESRECRDPLAPYARCASWAKACGPHKQAAKRGQPRPWRAPSWSCRRRWRQWRKESRRVEHGDRYRGHVADGPVKHFKSTHTAAASEYAPEISVKDGRLVRISDGWPAAIKAAKSSTSSSVAKTNSSRTPYACSIKRMLKPRPDSRNGGAPQIGPASSRLIRRRPVRRRGRSLGPGGSERASHLHLALDAVGKRTRKRFAILFQAAHVQ